MRTHGILMGLLTAGLFVSTASAQFIVNPVGNSTGDKLETSMSLAYSSVDYTIDETHKNHSIDRMVIGASLAKAVEESTDLFGSVAWLAKSDPSTEGFDAGSGYLLSLGARLHVFERGLGTVKLYGLGHYMAERYDYNSASYKMYLFEVTGGAIAAYAFNPSFTGYAGAELVAYSDGEFQGDRRIDIERDGRVTIRGGAVFDMTRYWIRAELCFGSETAFVAGAGRSF